MKWTNFYFVLLLALISVSGLMGQQRHVPEEYSSIQAAIDAASEGDTVLVSEGTYFENINFTGKAITVASQFIVDGNRSHIENTIIDGSQPANELKASVITIENVPTSKATLKGLTITGGSGTYLSAYQAYFGGGILIFNSGAIVESNVIRNNKIEKPDCGMPGIAAAPGEEDSIIIRDNRVVNNEVISTKMASGGGIALNLLAKNAVVRINDNIVSYNKVTTSGLYKVVGGGLYIATEYSYGTDIQVYNNIITNNELHCQSSFGGGIYVVYPYDHVTPLTSTQVRIFNNIISNNYSQDKGGGIGVWNMAKHLYTNLNYPPDPIISNNTITENMASDGSGIFNYDATTVLMNNIIWDSMQNENCREIYNYNFSGQYCFPSPPRWCTDLNRGILYSYNNDIKEGWENVNTYWIGQNNINSDPMLDPETFKLLEGSPCVGRGTDSVEVESIWMKAPSNEYYYRVRPNPIDKFIDIGAVESPFAKPIPRFYLADNGITIECEDCVNGDKGEINGTMYTAVDRFHLLQMINESSDLSMVCTSPVRDMSQLFFVQSTFNQDISSWDVSNVTNMQAMFSNAQAFNQNIGYWDVGNVENMKQMFTNAQTFNRDIGAWDVHNVVDMDYMFYHAKSFNQNLSNWCVENILEAPEYFADDCPLQPMYYPIWGTSTRIDEKITDNSVSVYPNPMGESLIIESETDPIKKVELIDITGRVVRQYKNLNSSTFEINRNGLQNGLYLIRIATDKVYVRKVMVE